MTKLMELAIERLVAVPAEMQDAVASGVLAELERQGPALQAAMAQRALHLRRLADEACEDFRAGSAGAVGAEAL